jgi:phage gpG-like protein
MATQPMQTIFKNEEVLKFLKSFHEKIRKSKATGSKYVGLLSAIVFADVQDHFETESDPDGRWKEWSKSYSEAVQGKAFYRTIAGRVVRIASDSVDKPPKPPRKPGMILQATGRMRNNFKPTKVKSTSGGILWFNDAKTKGGFPYAAAHDNGGDKLPQRSFMWLSNKAIEKIEAQTLQFLLDEGV